MARKVGLNKLLAASFSYLYRLPPCLRGVVRQEFFILFIFTGEKFRNDGVYGGVVLGGNDNMAEKDDC
jgi:hypothetical protein